MSLPPLTIRRIRSTYGWRPRKGARPQRYRVTIEATANGETLLASEHYRDRSDADDLIGILAAHLGDVRVELDD